MKRALLLALLLVPFAAQAASWQAGVPGMRIGPSNGAFSFLPPAEWNVATMDSSVVASRNGPLLDNLLVEWLAHGLPSKRLPRGSSPDTPLEDLAEDYVAGLQALGYADIKLLATEPAEFLDRPAFRVHLTYRLPDQVGGALTELLATGIATAKGVLIVTFDAPILHYFGEYWPIAEASLQGLQLGAAAEPPVDAVAAEPPAAPAPPGEAPQVQPPAVEPVAAETPPPQQPPQP